MTVQFVDYSWARPTQADLQGIDGVLRYLETGSSRPDLTGEEARQLLSWGKQIGLIWEKGTQDAAGGFDGGVAAAKAANSAADAIQAPSSVAIFYAIDSDMTADAVKPYFDGIRSVTGRPVGIYGSYALISWAKTYGIQWRWQALGWAYGKGTNPDAHLHQYQNNVQLASGAQVDRNEIFTQFPTWSARTETVVASTASKMIAMAASQIGYREGRDADGNWNNLTKYGIWYAEQVNNPAFRAVAWCDMFQSWCAKFSGNGDIIPLSAWVPGRLAYYRNKGQTGVFPPKPGDIGIVFKNGSAVHVFLVEKWLPDAGSSSAGYVQTIEGNTNDSGSPQGNGVYRLKRRDWTTNDGIVYCRPAYAPEPATPAPAPTPNPAPAPAPAPAPKPIPAPVNYSNTTAILLNDENLRLGIRSQTATYFNPRLWSWLYWHGGKDGRAFCQANYSAWMKESSALFGPTTLKAMQEAYRILNKQNPTAWPAKQTVNPKPTWPGPSFLRVLGLRAD